MISESPITFYEKWGPIPIYISLAESIIIIIVVVLYSGLLGFLNFAGIIHLGENPFQNLPVLCNLSNWFFNALKMRTSNPKILVWSMVSSSSKF
jgi:hypothetical protein